MPFQKGNKLGGRTEGAINKVNKEIKEAVAKLVESNLDNMTEWLKIIAKKDPEKAMYIIINLLEYNVPKLARTELTGKDGKDLIPKKTKITFE